MKKIIALILTLILLAIPFSSCKKETSPDFLPETISNELNGSSESSSDTEKETMTSADTSDDTTDTLPTDTESNDTLADSDEGLVTEESQDTEETVPTFNDGKIRLSYNGKVLYRVIRPKSGDSTKNIAMDVNSALNELNGDVRFEIKADNYPLKQDREILVGYTDRDETESVFSDLKVGGWTVREVNDKIVVYGTTYEALLSAAEYFEENISTDNNGTVILDIPEDGYTFVGESPFFKASNPLSSYTIVAPTTLTTQANALKAKLKSVYGVDLTVKASSEAATENEILIGDCGRNIEKSLLDEASKKTAGYSIAASQKKIVLIGHYDASTICAVDYFIKEFVTAEYSDEIQISNNLSVKSSTPYGDSEKVTAKAESAEVRIMSFNVLMKRLSGTEYNKPSSAERIPYVAATVLSFMPDVIGFQELDYFNDLKPQISSVYTLVNTSRSGGSDCYDAIAYNKSTVKLIANGTQNFTNRNGMANSKLMSWAVFEVKATGEKFALVNTHLDTGGKGWEEKGKTDYQPVQANDVAKKVNALKKEYNCPVFACGDFNSHINVTHMVEMMQTASLSNALSTAKTKIYTNYASFHDVGISASSGGSIIDHMLYTAGATPLLYRNVIDGTAVYASDHCPLFVDFKLN